MCGLDTGLGQAHGDAADFLDGPADERRRLRLARARVFDASGLFAWWRMVAIMANASMAKDTCRCQPCQDLLSLWSRPNSVLAHSKLSSMAQRWPSTWTNVSMPVPAGHHVVK